MSTVTLRYLPTVRDPFEPPERKEIVLEFVPNMTLHQYIKGLPRTPENLTLRDRFDIVRESTKERLRLGFVPRPDDVILFTPIGR